MRKAKYKVGDPDRKFVSKQVASELDKVKVRVQTKEWDYVTVIAGLLGSGKSTFAKGAAKHCDPDFNLDKVVFTAEDFINTTATCPEYSSVVYDECFEGMNTRVTLSPDFRRVVNHLQLIRKRHLFIFLCLPNFFDLQKSIAVFRTSHLWLTYCNEDGIRGKVMAFSRDRKRKLYVLGGKFMDYNMVRSNFVTRFYKNEDIYPVDDYEAKKDLILNARAAVLKQKAEGRRAKLTWADKAVIKLFLEGKTRKEIAELLGMSYQMTKERLIHYTERGAITPEQHEKLKKSGK